MPTTRLFLLEASFKTENERSRIYLFGKTEQDNEVIVIDKEYTPYFYLHTQTPKQVIEKISNISFADDNGLNKVISTVIVKKIVKSKEVDLIKVAVNTTKALGSIIQILKGWSTTISCYEGDIPFVRKYLIDNNISPLSLIEAEGEFMAGKYKTPTLVANKVQQTDLGIKEDYRLLSFEIKTQTHAEPNMNTNNPIMLISFSGEDINRSITWKDTEKDENIEVVKSEEELISRFIRFLKNYRPDFLIGYNSDNMDLLHLKIRAKKYRINTGLGLDNTGINMTTNKAMKINFPVHIDFIHFVKNILVKNTSVSSYSISEIGEYFLDREDRYKIKEVASFKFDSVTSENMQKICLLSIDNTKIIFDLFARTFIEIAEIIKSTSLTPFEATRESVSTIVEYYMIKEAKSFRHIIPNAPDTATVIRRKKETYTGGFVLEPTPGLFEDILVYDFKSMYPSIIASYNIDPETMDCHCCPKNTIAKKVMDLTKEDKEIWFCQQKKGFMPKIVEDLISRRERIKEIISKDPDNRILRAREKNLKLLANSFYGYISYFNARWYNIRCAQSITSIGRYFIKKVIGSFRSFGFKVIYSDTDSIFIDIDDPEKKAQIGGFVQQLNKTLPELMRLEEGGTYKRALFVRSREEGVGAKKRYALLDDKEQVIVKGFESVKRNISNIAKETQKKVIKIVLKENDKDKILFFVRKIVERLKEGKVNLKDVTIYTKLSKGIDSYETKSPHVKAAQRMKDRKMLVEPGNIIRYIITKGEGSIADRARLPIEVLEGEYDPEYYISNQVIPAVETIFDAIGIRKEDIFNTKDQSSLSQFMR